MSILACCQSLGEHTVDCPIGIIENLNRKIAHLKTERDRLQQELAEATRTWGGHNQPCYYCTQPCNALHGNPSLWPIPLCHADEPGKVKWHHIGCVSKRLAELAEAQRERNEARANAAEIKRLWAIFEEDENCRPLREAINVDNPGQPLLDRLHRAEAVAEYVLRHNDILQNSPGHFSELTRLAREALTKEELMPCGHPKSDEELVFYSRGPGDPPGNQLRCGRCAAVQPEKAPAYVSTGAMVEHPRPIHEAGSQNLQTNPRLLEKQPVKTYAEDPELIRQHSVAYKPQPSEFTGPHWADIASGKMLTFKEGQINKALIDLRDAVETLQRAVKEL